MMLGRRGQGDPVLLALALQGQSATSNAQRHFANMLPTGSRGPSANLLLPAADLGGLATGIDAGHSMSHPCGVYSTAVPETYNECRGLRRAGGDSPPPAPDFCEFKISASYVINSGHEERDSRAASYSDSNI